MFKWQQHQHRHQLIPGCALVTTTVLTALALVTSAGAAERAARGQNAGARPAVAGQDAGPVTARVGHEAECFLQRVDTQYVRCDNNTGNAVPAPAWIPQR